MTNREFYYAKRDFVLELPTILSFPNQLAGIAFILLPESLKEICVIIETAQKGDFF